MLLLLKLQRNKRNLISSQILLQSRLNNEKIFVNLPKKTLEKCRKNAGILSLQKSVPDGRFSRSRLFHSIVSSLFLYILQHLLQKYYKTSFGYIPQNGIFYCCVVSYRALTAATSKELKRYYFGTLRINTSRITLSVLSSSDLPQDLLAVKRSMGVPLVKFEDAKVELGTSFFKFLSAYISLKGL